MKYILSLLYTIVCIAPLYGENHWNLNIYEYRYDMSIYCQAVINDNVITDYSNYEIAAFVDDECRGVGGVQYKDGHIWLLLRVRSNSAQGDNLSFKLYDKGMRKETSLTPSTPVVFQSDSRIGLPSDPINLIGVIEESYTLGDVNEDTNINILDVLATLSIMKGDVGTFNQTAADANEDGSVNILDVLKILEIMKNQ